MGNVSEKELASFTVEFVNKVREINEDLILEGEDYFMHFGKKKIWFFYITDDFTAEECDLVFEPVMDVREFTDCDNCVAYLCCEGTLYEKLYGYDAWQEDVFGDGDEAEKLYHALFEIAGKYGLAFDWAGGALVFYDVQEPIKERL